MLPTRIELHNFTSYQDEIVDLTALHIAPLVGDNGSGKSSLVDAILMCLFGEATKGGKKELDNYRPDTGENEGSVALEFLLRGETYRIERARNYAKKKGSAKLLIKKGDKWENIGGKGIDDTQAAIESLLKVDYKTFTNSSIILQKDAESFAVATDGDRKKILAKILNLETWDQVQEIAKRKIGDLQMDLHGVSSRIQSLQDAINSEEHFQKRRKGFSAELDEAKRGIATLETEIADLQGQLSSRPTIEQQIQVASRGIESGRQRLSDIERKVRNAHDTIAHATQKEKEHSQVLTRKGAIEAAVELEKDLSQEAAEWDQKAKEVQALKARLQERQRESDRWEAAQKQQATKYETEIRMAQSRSDILEKVPCSPELGQTCPLLSQAWKDRNGIPTLEAQIRGLSQAKNPHAPIIDEILFDIDMAGYDQKAHETTRQQLAEVAKDARLKATVEAAEQMAQRCKEQIVTAQAEILGFETEKIGVEKEMAGFEAQKKEQQDQLNTLSPLSFEVTGKRSELAKHKQVEQNALTEIGRIDASLEQIGKARKELADLEAQTADSRKMMPVWTLIEKGCNKKGGVPALIIENALPQIENIANQLLSQMASGRFQIRFDTQIEGKTTGELSEGCRIVVMDRGHERPYVTYSGAEGFILNFALRIGIGLFLAHRSGAEIQLLVLDEGLGALSDANRQAIVDAIQKASQHFGRVLLITHIPEIQDAFTQRIEVSRNGEGSKVRVIA